MTERVLIILVNVSWQLALLFVMARLLLAIFKVRSASVRYVIWLAVALCPLALVPMNVISSDIVLLRAGNLEREAGGDHRFDLTGPRADESEKWSSPTRSLTHSSTHPPQPETGAFPRHWFSGRTRIKLIPLLILVWALGAGVAFALISAGYLRLKKLILKAHEVKDESTLGIFHQVSEESGISRRVRLLASNKALSPFSIGFIHPCIVLPDRMLGSYSKLRMVLVHEIVHLKRFDDLVNLLCRVTGSFMFFHPLFHLAFRELELSCEQICDGWAIRSAGTREDYANCLVELSHTCAGKFPIGFGRGNSMARRVKSIFEGEEVFRMIGRKSTVFISISLFLSILMISATRLVDLASAGQPVQISRSDAQKKQPERQVSAYTDNSLHDALGIQELALNDATERIQSSNDLGSLVTNGGVNVKKLYEEAETALQEKKYQEAIGKYEAAMKEAKKRGANTEVIDPDFDSLAKFKIAVCYAELGKQLNDPTMYEKSLEYISSVYEKQQLILRISDPDPGMPYGTMVLNDQVVSMEMLLASFQRGALKQKEMLIIQSGRDVPHNQIVEVMDLAKRAGIKKIGFAVVATKVPKVKEDLLFLWGDNYFRLERYEEAESKFRELLNDYPEGRFAENAYYSLGNLYYRLKQYDSSREAFRTILGKFPDSGLADDAQFLIARCFFDEANYDQASLEFEKVESENETLLAQARYYNGLSLLRVGRNQDALTAYQKFIADSPNSAFIPAAYFDMGTIHGKLKEYDEATRNYELAIQHTKDDVTKSHIRFQIGNNYFHQEDYQSAISSYRKLMDQYPESMHIPEARFMIAESHWWLKDYGSALAGYGEILKAGEPESQIPYATRRIGECHYQMGDKEMALEWYQKVLDNYPDSPTVKDATYSKIWSLNDLGCYEEAESVGRDYINKYKDDKVYDITAAEIQMMLGDIKFDAEDYISAADEYLRVPSDYSDLPKFDPIKSRSLLQAGFAYYKESDPRVRGGLSEEVGEWDVDLLAKAGEAFSRLLSQYKISFDEEKRELENRMKYITPTKAIEAFKKVLETHPESDMAPWAHLGIVVAYEAMGAYDMVVKVADEIEKQYADSGVPDAKRVIDIARKRKAAAAQKLK